jgi:hypothetical protein
MNTFQSCKSLQPSHHCSRWHQVFRSLGHVRQKKAVYCGRVRRIRDAKTLVVAELSLKAEQKLSSPPDHDEEAQRYWAQFFIVSVDQCLVAQVQ